MSMKSLLSMSLRVLVISFLLSAVLCCGRVKADTNVSGIISSDVTWTKANSPYSFSGNVLVQEGVTVTVEAGSVVNLHTYYLRVNGTMFIQPGVTIKMESMESNIQVNGVFNARGTSENPIHINGAEGYIVWIAPPSYSTISFSELSTGWNEQTGSGNIIENAIINSTSISMYNSLKLCNNVIDTGIYAYDGAPTISSNTIKAGISVKGGAPLISSNRFEGGYISFYGENGGENVRIIGNVISDAHSTGGASAGIWFGGSRGTGGTVLIEKNLITNNFKGIWIFSPNFEDLKTALTIQDNTIINNQEGITVQNRYAPTKIGKNNIYDNQINFKLEGDASLDIDAVNNWWGTTDSQAIEESIVDFEDDFDLGKVSFVPFLSELNPEAPEATYVPSTPSSPVASPTPTIEPTPETTPTPSPEPTTSASPTPTPSNEPQSSDQQVILGAAITVAVLCVGLGLLVYLIKRK